MPRFACVGQHSSETLGREEYSIFLSQLKEKRLQAKLSQNEAARRLGISQAQLWAIESGIRRLDVIEFIDIAIVLEFDPAEFLLHHLNAVGNKHRERIKSRATQLKARKESR